MKTMKALKTGMPAEVRTDHLQNNSVEWLRRPSRWCSVACCKFLPDDTTSRPRNSLRRRKLKSTTSCRVDIGLNLNGTTMYHVGKELLKVIILWKESGWLSRYIDELRAGRPGLDSWQGQGSPLHSIQTGSGASYTIDSGSFFLRGKTAGAWSWPLPSSAVVKNGGDIPPLPHMSSWQGV
jgi:hypothetical protein